MHLLSENAELLRSWRQRRGISVSALARQAGIHRTTITGWETGQYEPSVPELERMLDVLEVPAQERRAYWHQSTAPRALKRLRTENEEFPVALGDLLRALRLRSGRTQSDVARQAEITQGLLARWENNLAVPDTTRLHTLCLLLNASTEEIAALTLRLYQKQEPLPDNLDGLTASFHELTYVNVSLNKDLLFLAHAAHCLRLIRQGSRGEELLAQVWGRQAHYVQWRWHRDQDAIQYGQAALKRLPATLGLDAHLTASIIALAQARVRQGEVTRGIDLLQQWQERMTRPVYRHWSQSAIATCLSLAGMHASAITMAAEAFHASEPLRSEYTGDYLNRMWDYVESLLLAKDGANALRILDQYSVFPSSAYPDSDYTHEMLLRAEASALVGQQQEAATLLAMAQSRIVEPHPPFLERIQRITGLLAP